MAALARQDRQALSVQWFSSRLASPRAVDAALRSVWRFQKDPPGVEYVASPDLQIVRAVAEYAKSGSFQLHGDCDEAATLAASLLLSFNEPSRLVAIRQSGRAEFSHVFLRWADGDIDPTLPVNMLPLWDYEEALEWDV